MIYYISGELMLCELGSVVIDCSGIGYNLVVSDNTQLNLTNKLHEKIKLMTHMQIKEDAIELYGFLTNEEIHTFRLLLLVSGVGPKAAMSILSLMSPERFASVVISEDMKALSKASGIGAKTAARIVLELKDKLSRENSGINMAVGSTTSNASNKLSEAQDALLVLGYTRAEAIGALRGISLDKLSLEEIVKKALAQLFSATQ